MPILSEFPKEVSCFFPQVNKLAKNLGERQFVDNLCKP
jgi:hypothetical protein